MSRALFGAALLAWLAPACLALPAPGIGGNVCRFGENAAGLAAVAGRNSCVLRGAKGQGTAFLLRSAAGRELVTAAHNPSASDGEDESSRLLAQSCAALGLKEVRFQKSSRDFSVALDLVKTRPAGAPGLPEGLSAAQNDYVPEPGTRMLLTGFPNAGRKTASFKQYPCRFLGYTTRLGHEAARYVLDCAAWDDLAGNSGGAVLDSCTGDVVGALAEQNDYQDANKGLVIVAPLALDRRGAVAFGIQNPVTQALCYSEGEGGRIIDAPKPCRGVLEAFRTDVQTAFSLGKEQR